MTVTSDVCTTETSVYRYYDEKKLLLYVGVSKHPFQRLKEHRRDKFWHLQVHNIETEWFPSKSAAHRAERLAIAFEQPLYNRTGQRDCTIVDFPDGLLFADIMMDIRNNSDVETREIYLTFDDLVHYNSATTADVMKIVAWLSKIGIVRLRGSCERMYWVLVDDIRSLIKPTTTTWIIDKTGKPRLACSQ